MTKKPTVSEVVAFPRDNAGNIAVMLRAAADAVESEGSADDRTFAVTAVHISENGQITVYGWGKTNGLESMGHLHLGLALHYVGGGDE